MVALPTLAIYLGVLGLTFLRLATLQRDQLEREMTTRAVSDAARFDAAFERLAAVARTTAQAMESAPDLTEEQWAETAAAVHRVLRKILHRPSVRAKEFSTGPEGPVYLDALRQLFDLDAPADASAT